MRVGAGVVVISIELRDLGDAGDRPALQATAALSIGEALCIEQRLGGARAAHRQAVENVVADEELGRNRLSVPTDRPAASSAGIVHSVQAGELRQSGQRSESRPRGCRADADRWGSLSLMVDEQIGLGCRTKSWATASDRRGVARALRQEGQRIERASSRPVHVETNGRTERQCGLMLVRRSGLRSRCSRR